MAYIGQKPGSNFRDVNLKDSFTGDGSTVAFDLSKSFSQADVNGIEVFVDNVRQEPTVAYTVGQDGNGDFKRVTFTAAPAASASIYVLNPGVTSGVLSVSDGSVTSAKLNADVISGQTELAEAANNADTLLLNDASATALKKITVSNLTAQAGTGLAKTNSTLAVDIDGTAALTDVASSDTVLVFDASSSTIKKITQLNFLNSPTVSSVSPTNVLSGDGSGNHTIVITGTNFVSGAQASLINSSGATVSFDSQTRDSATQITGVIAKSSLLGSGEPYDVKVVNPNGISGQLDNQINVDQQPVFSTAAGSLGTFTDAQADSISLTVAAADPESGGDIVYTIESGSIPAGLTFASTSSGATITGNADAVGSETTSTFTIRAKDVNSNTSDRQFTITIQPPVVQTFTSSGTFNVPSGVSSVQVLVVGGGGGAGSSIGGGGGAGGLVYHPNYPVTPGGTVSVTVGEGGAGDTTPTGPGNSRGTNGQNSVFGTITAQGGGAGGSRQENPYAATPGNNGASGGGSSSADNPPAGTGGTATQGNSGGGTGYGSDGGDGKVRPPHGSGGGGGAGAAGANANSQGIANGGVGRSYTIADGTTSVYYAGGGAGVGPGNPGSQGGQGGGGSSAYNTLQEAGVANRGGGGGGGSFPCSPTYPNNLAGPGGKGVVIVRWG